MQVDSYFLLTFRYFCISVPSENVYCKSSVVFFFGTFPHSLLNFYNRVRAKTASGDCVYVIGDGEQLGNWIPSQAQPLSTTTHSYPQWEGTLYLPRGETFRYKYVIINENTQLIKWESKKKEFRSVTTTGNISMCSFVVEFILLRLHLFL
jgi:hypothetical protein